MGFSKKIKDKILVASARHCCVCHRYVGIKIEVHHIIPKEQGGEDTFENAIPLCFDCHSDVGHYNTKHPRGTRFSISELRKHKEKWFNIVSTNSIPQKFENTIHARYLITKEFHIIKNISNTDLSGFPIENCLLYENQTLDFFRKIFKNQNYRNLVIENALNINPDEYSIKYPNAIIFDKKEDDSIFYYHERIPTVSEINKVCSNDCLTSTLIKNKVEVNKIARVLTSYDGECCGELKFFELFQLRPLYFKFLILTNLSGDYIKLKELSVLEQNMCLFSSEDLINKETMQFPDVLIEPNQSVVVPLGMFLADFDGIEMPKESTRIRTIENDYSIVLDHSIHNSAQVVEYFFKNFEPKQLKFEKMNQVFSQDIHVFNFNNLYCLDGFWNCGSCPHLFFEMNDNRLIYKGEIFNNIPKEKEKLIFNIGKSIKQIIIAELEHEITTIDYIKLNNVEIISNVSLFKGEDLKVQVSENDLLEICGYYQTKSDIFIKASTTEKHRFISEYILRNQF